MYCRFIRKKSRICVSLNKRPTYPFHKMGSALRSLLPGTLQLLCFQIHRTFKGAVLSPARPRRSRSPFCNATFPESSTNCEDSTGSASKDHKWRVDFLWWRLLEWDWLLLRAGSDSWTTTNWTGWNRTQNFWKRRARPQVVHEDKTSLLPFFEKGHFLKTPAIS